MNAQKGTAIADRSEFLANLGDTVDDLEIALTTCRVLLPTFPDPIDDAQDPKFDIERIKLVDFIQAGTELAALLRRLAGSSEPERIQ